MKIKPWIYASRPKTLVASIIPIVSSAIIIPDLKIFKPSIFLLTIISAMIIQIITNYVNDLFDFLNGADKNRSGPKRMLQSGLLSETEIKNAIKILLIMGILSGFPLVIHGGWAILLIGLSSFLFAYLYTAGPIPLAYNGLGDLFVFIYFGLIAVMGSYYLQTGFIDQNSVWLGISIGAKNVILLCINNIRDYTEDKKNNKKTLIVYLGQNFGRVQILFLFILSYISLFNLSIGLGQHLIFYLILIGVPISINILYDSIYKKETVLNKTLAKVSALLVIETCLLIIGFNL